MIDLEKLKSLFGRPETAALIEDSEYMKIQNDDKAGIYSSPHIFDATKKTVKDIVTSLSLCEYTGMKTFYEGAAQGYSSDVEIKKQLDDSKYYIIIRNIDKVSPSHGKWDDLIDIIKSQRYNGQAEFLENCLIVITKSDLSNINLELDVYCTKCIQ